MTSATTTTTGIDVTEEEKTEAAVEQQPQKVDEEEIKEGLALAEGGESSSANVVEAAQGKPISEIDGAVIAVPDGDDDDDESRKRKAIEDPDNAANKKNEDATTAADQSPNDQLPRTQDADTAAESNIYKRARTLPTRVAWEDRLASLRAYKTEHGHLNIPIRYKANPSLGKFVHNTREQFKLYHHQCKPGYQKRCSLTPERVVELDAIGFIWTTERVKRQNEDWAGRLEQLKEYKDQHGDCMVPHGYEVDPSFAEWIHRQRTTYASMLKEKIPNPMVLDRMNKLDELGFNFTVHSDKWMDHWMLLKEYKEKHGHCQVPTHYVENPRLGRWTHTQRHQRRLQQRGKKSCTTPERIALLDELGFSWEVRAPVEQPRATWHQRCDELKKFHQIHNHFLVPAETHPKLHVWCHEQKNRLKKLDESGRDSSRRMGPARVHTLQELGFTKDTPLADVQRINEAEMTTVPEVNEPMAQTVAVDVAVDDHAAAAALPAAFRDRLDEPLAAAAGEAADDDHAVSETVDALRAVNDTVEAAVNEQMDTTTGNKTTTNDLTHFV